MGTSTIRANSITYPILADSEVYQSGEGYERIVLVGGWHPSESRRVARIFIRVDRNPAESFAHVDVWTPNSGWQMMNLIAPNEFWGDMPGYLRWANDTSDAKTQRLASDLLAELVAMIADDDALI